MSDWKGKGKNGKGERKAFRDSRIQDKWTETEVRADLEERGETSKEKDKETRNQMKGRKK